MIGGRAVSETRKVAEKAQGKINIPHDVHKMTAVRHENQYKTTRRATRKCSF